MKTDFGRDKLICMFCKADQVDYGSVSITMKGIQCAKCHKYNNFRVIKYGYN